MQFFLWNNPFELKSLLFSVVILDVYIRRFPCDAYVPNGINSCLKNRVSLICIKIKSKLWLDFKFHEKLVDFTEIQGLS